jgi:hypothetical protein
MVELGLQPRPQQSVSRPSALVTRIGHLADSSCQHWPTTSEKRMDCILCHAYTKKRCWIQSVKSSMLDCAYKDISKIISHTKAQL